MRITVAVLVSQNENGFMAEEKKNDRPKKEMGAGGGTEGGREKVGVIRKKKITEQLRKFKLDETYLPGELLDQIQVLPLLKSILLH